MCKYCTEYEDLPEHVVDDKPVGRIFDTCIQEAENGWHIELPSGLDIGIKYCPYCGRDLTLEEDKFAYLRTGDVMPHGEWERLVKEAQNFVEKARDLLPDALIIPHVVDLED